MAAVTLTNFFLIIFLVLLNGFFVASEFAFVKIRHTQIEALKAQGSKRAFRMEQIVTNLDRSMSSTQLGITLASIALGFVGEEFFHAIFEGILHALGLEGVLPESVIWTISFVSGYLVITFLHVVLGELAPKSISIQFAVKTALFCAEPLWWFMKVTGPLLNFFVWSSNMILKLFGIEPAQGEHHEGYSEDELKAIINDSIMKGYIEPYESRLIFNILDFTDSNVKSILTPRIDLELLSDDCEVNDIINVSIDTGFSRIPIYHGSFDNIIGFVHVKDVLVYSNGLREDHPDFDLEDVMRPVITVPEGKPLDDLLNEMQRLKTQMAVIVDEYGSVEGIVTIEDILEYIVGPIDDEFDHQEAHMNLEISEMKIKAGGLLSLDSFNVVSAEQFAITIESDDSATLAGYVLELFESEIPQEGMIGTDGLLNFKILSQQGNRIEEIEVTKSLNWIKIIPDIRLVYSPLLFPLPMEEVEEETH